MSRLTCGHIQHMYSWWWVRLSPETCRVKPLRRIKNAIVASCWTYFTTTFLFINFFICAVLPCNIRRFACCLQQIVRSCEIRCKLQAWQFHSWAIPLQNTTRISASLYLHRFCFSVLLLHISLNVYLMKVTYVFLYSDHCRCLCFPFFVHVQLCLPQCVLFM